MFRFQENPSKFTTDYLRNPPTALLSFRSVQLLLAQLNFITDIILFLLNNIIIFGTILCNFIIIRSHDTAGLPVLLIVVTASISGFACVMFTHIKFGEIHESSKCFIVSWRRNLERMCKHDQVLFRKYLISCRAFGVSLGPFSFYHKPNTFRVAGKIILYTTKFLLMVNKHTS